jgi:hypothetical protein
VGSTAVDAHGEYRRSLKSGTFGVLAPDVHDSLSVGGEIWTRERAFHLTNHFLVFAGDALRDEFQALPVTPQEGELLAIRRDRREKLFAGAVGQAMPRAPVDRHHKNV